jgi:hypothetical protein
MKRIKKRVRRSVKRVLLRALVSLCHFARRFVAQDTVTIGNLGPHRYNDNSRYLFEYISRESDLEIYWPSG